MRSKNLGTCVLALLVMACGGAAGPAAPQATGRLELPLTSPGPDGQLYELVGATFTFTGPENLTITDTSSGTVSVPLTAGLYSVQLGGNWRMERVAGPGQAGQVVPAQLISPNPMGFSIGEGQSLVLRFLFKIPGNGDAELGFTVDTGGWLTGTLNFTHLSPPGADNLFAGLAGQSVPFTISFASATFTREGGFQPALRVQTSPITLQFGGAPSVLLQERVIPALQSVPSLNFRLERTSNGMISFTGFDLPGLSEPFVWRVFPSAPFPGTVDADGFPRPQAFGFEAPTSLEFFGGSSASRVEGIASGSVEPL